MGNKLRDIFTMDSPQEVARMIVDGRKNQRCWTCAYSDNIPTGRGDSVIYCKMKNEYILIEPIQLCLFYNYDLNQK